MAPLTRESGGPTVLFVVDALRYEMAQALVDKLGSPQGTKVHLEPRLAELPTITSVGMNVLAPVAAGGKLRPILDGKRITGFHTGQFTVSDPKSRQRQMQARVGGATCPWLELDDVVGREASSLKQSLKSCELAVVHSREIDKAGESDVGSLVFEHVLQKILAAWRLLRDAGARRFVLTADHGFLLLDNQAGLAQAHGRPIDPKRRHVLSPVAADHDGEVRVSLRDLGYEDVDGHLMFPETTAVFDTGRHTHRFVHGGNSLQERVIPVLTLLHRHLPGGTNATYRIAAQRTEPLGTFHSLSAEIHAAGDQQLLSFSGLEDIEIALRVPEDSSVQVEVHQVRGGSARLESGVVTAHPGEPFDVFFRLRGRSEKRVAIELYHPAGRAEVAACLLSDRFAVSGIGHTANEPDEVATEEAGGDDWLESLPAGGIRALFRHLEKHGSIAEPDVVQLLGSGRAGRRFAAELETYAQKAPFAVRVEVVGGVKRYVKGT